MDRRFEETVAALQTHSETVDWIAGELRRAREIFDGIWAEMERLEGDEQRDAVLAVLALAVAIIQDESGVADPDAGG